MKKLAYAIAAIALIGTPAFAADMAVKAAPPAAPPAMYTWTGLYVGVNLGLGWSSADFSIVPTGAWLGAPASIPYLIATDRSLLENSFVGGGQVGYNYQINQVVFGVEGDFDYYNAEDKFLGGPIPTTSIVSYSQQTNQNWLATVRGRLGWAFDHLLVYGTGGAAFSDWQVNMHMTSAGVDAIFLSDETRTGWTAGGGAEYAIDPRWSIKGEYLYSDFGTATGTSVFPPPNAPNFTHNHSVRLVTEVARVGVNYKFW
jgi:outer membrane immunogenic protein